MTNQANRRVSNAGPHFILVPLVAQGHMIPAVDMACLLADRGALVTLVTTPANAARIKPAIDRAGASRLPVRFVQLDFPCAEAGLPDGCENLDMIARSDLYVPFYRGLRLLREPLERYLRGLELANACMISDSCNYWTMDVARALNIPRLVFHGPSCFYVLCSHKIREGVDGGEAEAFVVPGLPRRIEVTRAQAPGSWFSVPGFEEIRERVEESEAAADGVVVNTFYELEPEYIDIYREAVGKMVLPIGPLSLYNKDIPSKYTRGNKAAIDNRRILDWLDSMEPKSVLYLNFGSLIHTGPSQLIEIGNGLEATNRPFVWVIKRADHDKWMSEGFEERTAERGLIITGWAPQTLILSHPSAGGFVTHCGWNSILEAVSAGVPMVTWPHIADQFLNEKLAVEILGIAVDIGAKEPSFSLDGDEARVKGDVLARAVSSLMDGGEEGERRRERARVLGEKARAAMEEGGSSYENVDFLIKSFSG